MVTQTQSPSDSRPNPSAALQGRLHRLVQWAKALPQTAPRFLQWVWTKQRHWLLPLLPFLFLLYRPLRLAWGMWFSFDSPLLIQAFVPLLAFSLSYERRADIANAYEEYHFLWPAGSKRHRGHIWLAALGCILMVLAVMALVPAFAVFALVLIFMGVIYQLYGWFVVGQLWRSFVFLLLMIPPGSLLNRVIPALQLGNTVFLSTVLRPIFPAIQILGNVLLLPNTRMTITPEFSGISVVFPVMVLTIWQALRRNVPYFNYPLLLMMALVASLLVNAVRVAFIAIISNSDSLLAATLSGWNSWLLTLFAAAIMYPIVNLFTPRRRTALGEGENTL